MSEGTRLEYYESLVDRFLSDHRGSKVRAARRAIQWVPEFADLSEEQALRRRISEDDARLIVAKETGFEDWSALDSYFGDLNERDFDERFEEAVEAVIHGDEARLKELLSEDPFLARAHSPRPHGATLLHYNAANGVEDERQNCPDNAVEIGQLLIDAGADINVICDVYGGGAGSTPLVNLVTSEHPDEAGLMDDLVRVYASKGQTLDGVESDGLPMASALLFRKVSAAETLAECGAQIIDIASAAALGKLDRVQEMLIVGEPPQASGPMPASPFGWRYDPDRALELALLLASTAGEVEVVRYLIEQGVNVNARLHHDFTPLHEAAFAGAVDVVELLVKAGADISARDRQYGSTPWGWAEEGEQQDVLRWLTENCDVELGDLVESGNAELVAARLDSAPDAVNGSDGSGVPLRIAAAAGDEDMVALLLRHGADVTLTNSQGKSALDWAEENGHGEIAVLLWNSMNAQGQSHGKKQDEAVDA